MRKFIVQEDRDRNSWQFIDVLVTGAKYSQDWFSGGKTVTRDNVDVFYLPAILSIMLLSTRISQSMCDMADRYGLAPRSERSVDAPIKRY